MSKLKQGEIDIHGKTYQTVALRVSQFRKHHPDWTIASHVVENTENRVVVKAEIANEQGRLISTGYAEEFRAASKINKTSALENAETSAVGRALAFLGLGGEQIASADEVLNAVRQQEALESSPGGRTYEEWQALLESDTASFCAAYLPLDEDTKTEVFNVAPKGEKTRFKAEIRDAERFFFDDIIHPTVSFIDDAISRGDDSELLQALEEITPAERPYVWAGLNEEQKLHIKQLKAASNE